MSVFDQIKTCELFDGKYLPRSTTHSLDSFEAEHSVALPLSYRDFCNRFGPGMLAGFYRFAAPICIPHHYNLEDYNATWHGDPTECLLDNYAPPEITRHFLFFADSAGGDGFAWKLDEPNSRDDNEYNIYCFRSEGTITIVSPSFTELIEKMLSGFSQVFPGSADSLDGVVAEFTRIHL